MTDFAIPYLMEIEPRRVDGMLVPPMRQDFNLPGVMVLQPLPPEYDTVAMERAPYLTILDLWARQGDTFLSRDIARFLQPDGTPVAVQSARMQVRLAGGAVLYEWTTEGVSPNMLIGESDNLLTLLQVAPEVTELWEEGYHRYDLEVTFVGGQVLTPVGGAFTVSEDVTQNDPPPP